MATRNPLVLVAGEIKELPSGDTVNGVVAMQDVTTILDANYASISLLLHGANLADNSPTPKTVTAVGNAAVSTVQSKFGGSSFAFDGAGDYLTVPASTATSFDTGDFTVEMWLYANSTGADMALYDGMALGGIGGRNNSFLLHMATGGTLKIFTAGAVAVSTASVITALQWTHIAVSRSAGSLKVFIGGILGATLTLSTNMTPGGAVIGVLADSPAGYNLNGYLDDIRVTKGVARYTANFSPPVAAFPDAYSVTTSVPVNMSYASRGRMYANARGFALP